MNKKLAFLAGDKPEAAATRQALTERYGDAAPADADVIVAIGGDGFMLSPIYCPGAIEEFVDLVVPELQLRGRFRTSYTGTTQRDHLRQTS